MQNHSNVRDKVLVLGDDDRTVLPIARSLGRRGIEVHLGWCPLEGPTAASRFVKKIHTLPDFSRKRDDWKQGLSALLSAEEFRLVIPATEHAVYALQTSRQDFESDHSIYLLDDPVFRAVSDKSATYRTAQAVGIDCPTTYLLDGNLPEDLRRSLTLPVVIKPITSVDASTTLSKVFVRRADTWKDARDYIGYLAGKGAQVLLQPCFNGRGVGVSVLADKGEIRAAVQHVRLHETSGYGSTYRTTVPLSDDLLGACRRFVEALGYTGVGMFEFRVNEATGKWVLLEVNGRFWGSLPLAVAAGVDFPYLLYQLTTRGKTDAVQGYRVGVRSRTLTSDLRWHWRTLRRKGTTFDREKEDALGWAVNQTSLLETLTSLVRGGLAMDHIDSFAWDDPLPTGKEIGLIARGAAEKLIASLLPARRPRSEHVAKDYQSEWDG